MQRSMPMASPFKANRRDRDSGADAQIGVTRSQVKRPGLPVKGGRRHRILCEEADLEIRELLRRH